MGARRGVVRRGLGGATGLIVLATFVLPSSTSAGGLPSASRVAASGFDVGPERPIADAGPPVTSYSGPGTTVFGGDIYLSAWVDARGGIWASRLSRTGDVLDPTGIPISSGDRGREPAIASDGTDFLVTWSAEGGDIVARRVTADGAMPDSAPIVVDRGHLNDLPMVEFDGTDYLVAWRGATDGRSGVAGRWLSPAGVVDRDRQMFVPLPAGPVDLDMAFNGTDHYVVWQQGSYETADLFGMLVDPAGSAAGPPTVISTRPGPQEEASVTSVGSSFFVAWKDGIGSGNGGPGTSEDIYGTSVDSAGVVLHPSGVPITATPYDEEAPAVASDGTDVLVAWRQIENSPYADNIRGARVGPADTVLDPAGLDFADLTFQAAVASDGVNYLAAANGPVSWSSIRIDQAGTVLDPAGRPIAVATSGQTETDMVFDGSRFMTVWSDGRGGIYGARVGPDGEKVDGSGFPIAAGGRRSAPVLAFDGTNHLVVWQEGATKVSGALMTGAGVVISRFDVATTVVPTRTLSAPAVAFGGGTFLVAWAENQPAEHPEALAEARAARVTTGGAVLDSGGVLLSRPGSSQQAGAPTVAYGTSDFLVVWPEMDWDSFLWRLSGARIGPTGAPVTPSVMVRDVDATPDMAWGDGNYLLVWSDTRNDTGYNRDIYGTRVSATGEVLDPDGIPISTSREEQTSPSVAFNGSFLVAWQDRRWRKPHDIYSTRVEADGSVPHPGAFPVSRSPQLEQEPVVAAAPGDGQFAVVYQRMAIEAPYGNHRAFFRNVSPK